MLSTTLKRINPDNDPYNKEINNYLEQPIVESDDSPLLVVEGTYVCSCVFPLLAKMAKKYLCVPGIII